MTTYAVHRQLPGITMEQLVDAQKASIAMTDRMSHDGTPIRYIRSTFYPADQSCICFFEAQTLEDVRKLNVEASLPFDDIQEAFDVDPYLLVAVSP